VVVEIRAGRGAAVAGRGAAVTGRGTAVAGRSGMVSRPPGLQFDSGGLVAPTTFSTHRPAARLQGVTQATALAPAGFQADVRAKQPS